MTAYAQDQDLEEFLSKSTPWREDESYLFTDIDGVKGMFRREPAYSKRVWSMAILREPQEWSTTVTPKTLPTSAPGTYTYLVELGSFDFEKDPKAIIHDFLWPWDSGNTVRTGWLKHENGTLRVAYSRHAQHRHIVRHITFFVNEQDEPVSHVLFEYIVENKETREESGNEELADLNSTRAGEFEGAQKEKVTRRKSDKGQGTSVMTDTIDGNDEVTEFLSKCTPWSEEGLYKFVQDGVTGLYRKVPEFPGKAWGIQVLREPQDWTTTNRPEFFPMSSVGSYRYLVDKKVFKRDPKAIVNDFMHPWETAGTTVKWSNTLYENGNLRHSLVRHPRIPNIRRYITFFSDDENLPTSPVLYQYVVEPRTEVHDEEQPSTSKAKSTSLKRKTEQRMTPDEDEILERLQIPKQTAKRVKSVSRLQPIPPKASPSMRRTAERKPMVKESSTPTPPASEPRCTPQPVQQQHQQPQVLLDLEEAYNNLQQTITDTKLQYCSLTNPIEMTAMNQKLIRLYALAAEFKEKVSNMTEHTKTTTRDIVMDMEAPLPTYQAPVPRNQDNSEVDTPHRSVSVKTE